MKKIHVICKTHLDLGFTDFAANILSRYRGEFIPNAIKLAGKLNSGGEKKFVWTTGSYLIYDSLKNAAPENRQKLDDAIRRGYITWHALPFTTHTELLDEDVLRYGLDIAKELDNTYGKKTVAAKMTDVPGHTKAILPILREYGIKLLHIGVNEASCLPNVPDVFLWKDGDAEVAVIYEGSYGGAFKNEYIDDILYFLHSGDNHGPSNEDKVNEVFTELRNQYPDYEISASSLDEYAEELYKVKDKLPIITSEIGDTWIHGIASDPYKTGAYRELAGLKNQWLANGKLKKGSPAYNGLCDGLLTVSEHTWGMDVKRYLSDYVYLKNNFAAARKKDKVTTRLTLDNLYHKYLILKFRKKGIYLEGSYSAMEKSWQEQRDYLDKAINALDEPLKNEALSRFEILRPATPFDKTGYEKLSVNSTLSINNFNAVFNETGLCELSYGGNIVLKNTYGAGTINYFSYGAKDYDFWQRHYTRDYDTTKEWSAPDFLRPGLKSADKKYPQGMFPYTLTELYHDGKSSIISVFTADKKICEKLGAPRLFEIRYAFDKNDVKTEVVWLGKDASRLTEAVFINFPVKIDKNSLRYTKIGKEIDPFDIVECGNRNLSAVENVTAKANGLALKITNVHAPLASIGLGKILRFDNIFEDVNEKGISFNLYNNVWGTNFPLWYEENAYFEFILSIT
ncbi:MAG TPA: DUF5054 domain-containing protein [Clostridia bacterium]|nr:DUF5054 domain-containing protein [Clostridia bacterium]